MPRGFDNSNPHSLWGFNPPLSAKKPAPVVEQVHSCGWPEGSEQCRIWHHADIAAPVYRARDGRPDDPEKR